MRKDNGISQFEFKYLVSYWLSHLNNMPTGNELKLLYHFKRNKVLKFLFRKGKALKRIDIINNFIKV
ncbi:CLUMA_CG007591, isoform A [Clunio marinus]|uniref:CLUMA_CG007591, isoform A n=1 Tax=Clunio marinus TaxID=568069 RepID=A0A1J1I396_9DIPT|nr:CLUMA_CG007591, isoform A [Clunio marinus]